MDFDKENLPLHVAITMDGNGRWATNRKLPRTSGHDEGLKTVKRIVKKAIEKYPESELQDILKMLYQNEFGPKHLAENEIECFKTLVFSSTKYGMSKLENTERKIWEYDDISEQTMLISL